METLHLCRLTLLIMSLSDGYDGDNDDVEYQLILYWWTGGAAGAVSRITGTLGKGLATLTMDEEYQKKRREAINKRPAGLKEGIAHGGHGLVMVRYDRSLMWTERLTLWSCNNKKL